MCASDLTNWNRNHFQHLQREVDDCRKKIERLRGNVDESNINIFNELRNRMSCLLVQEDAF